MKKMNLLLLIMIALIVSGCAESSALIKTSSTSIRSDVFKELSNGSLVPPGYTDLRITSSLKVHKPGIYSASDIHGTPDYTLLLNIDGQVAQLQGRLREENIEPTGLSDPEAGEGIRYQFNKKLRLKAGTHKLVIVIPADGLAIEREISLAEGSNNLALEPIYGGTPPGKQRPCFYGVTSYKEGIRWFRLVLNGKTL